MKLNLYKINLGVSELNISALSLYNSLGFKKEGILVGQIFKNNIRVNIINMSLFSNTFKP